MKHVLLGLFGGYLAGCTLFMVQPLGDDEFNKDERTSFTLGIYIGVPLGLATIVAGLAYLTLTRGY